MGGFFNMVTKIDTIEVCIDKSNLIDPSIINKDIKPYISKVMDKGDKLFVVIHISRSQGTYNYGVETYTYDYFKKQMEWIIKDLYVLDVDKVLITRVDQCFDYKHSFDNMYKLNNMLTLLYALEIKAELKDVIERNTVLGQIKTSIEAQNKGKSKQLYIYNKDIESDSRHPYSTRQELRIKRLKLQGINFNDIDAILNLNYDILGRLSYNFYAMEDLQIKYLYALYCKELEERKIYSFNSFIIRYNEQITTRRICEELYYCTNHRGQFKNWIKEYRKKIDLQFVSKYEVETSIKNMQRATKKYRG